MIARIARSIALFGTLAMTLPAFAQTTGTGTTGTGTTGTTGGITGGAGGAGSSRVTSSGGGGGGSSGFGGSGFGNSGSSSGSGPFQGTVPASFSGNAGTSTSTNTTGGGRGISGTNAVPSTSNPWLSTYGNPYAIGQSVLGSGSTAKASGVNKGFGQSLYSTTNTSIGTTTGLQSNSNSGNGFNNTNISKAPRYTSALAEDVPFVSHPPALLQAKLQDILTRSSTVRSDRIQVVVDGGTVFLLGQVGSERERRLAESMLRLTPGVDDIENRLTLPGAP